MWITTVQRHIRKSIHVLIGSTNESISGEARLTLWREHQSRHRGLKSDLQLRSILHNEKKWKQLKIYVSTPISAEKHARTSSRLVFAPFYISLVAKVARVLNVEGRTAINRSNLRESGKRRGQQKEAIKFVREGTRIIRSTRGDGTNSQLGKTRTEA